MGYEELGNREGRESPRTRAARTPARAGIGPVAGLVAMLREARSGWRSLDPAAFSGLLGALVFLAGGVLAISFTLAPAGWPVRRFSTEVALAVIGVGLAGLALPWERWGTRAQLLYPVSGFVLVAFAAHGARTGVAAYVAVYTLLFVLVGFSQPLGSCVALMPVALVALRLGLGGAWSASMLVEVVLELSVAATAGEAVALVLRRQRQAEVRIERLLNAVRVLARITDEREGAEVLAALAAELVEADAAAVYLADSRAPNRCLNRAWGGHPALADSAPLVVDVERLRSGWVGFFSDAVAAGLVGESGRSRARAAALVPLPGDGTPLGAVLVMWGTPRRSLPRSARQAAELLSQEAGRMFNRMRTAAVLVHEAETDPLTSLANRRTFARALDLLAPGDAVVVIDLDHFKAVNDTHGHDKGDETLRRLAKCLRSVSRQVDCVARYGGEEFALVLVGAGESGSRVVLQRLQRAWAATNPVTTFSAGIAIHDADEPPAVTLHRADLALYRAKDRGRNRAEFADREIVLS